MNTFEEKATEIINILKSVCATLSSLTVKHELASKQAKILWACDGEKHLTAERKQQLKGTLFEHCNTEAEVTAVHFQLME